MSNMQLRVKWLPVVCSAALPASLVLLLYLYWPPSEVKHGLHTSQHLNISDLNFPAPKLTFSYGPHFHFIEKSSVFPLSEQAPGREFSPQEASWFLRIQDKAAEHLSGSLGQTIRQEDFLHGRYRFLPSGLEFDFYFRSPDRALDLRVTLFQPVGLLHVVRLTNIDPKQVVSVVVPVSSASNRLRDFLDHLAEGVLPFDDAFSLALFAKDPQVTDEVISMAQDAFKALPGFKWKVEASDALWKSGLPKDDAAAKGLGDVVLVAEEEPFLHPDFLARCRGNVARGRQVYFPIPFALFDPRVTYPLFEKEVPHLIEQLEVKEHFGYWKSSRAVAACVARADLATLLKETRRGLVSGMFKEALMSKTIKIIRAPDPSLFLVYQDSNCTSTEAESYPDCVKEKAMNLGSQEVLGMSLLKIKEGMDFEGILSKRFQYFSLIPLLAFAVVFLLGCNCTQTSLIYRQAKTLRMLRAEATRKMADPLPKEAAATSKMR
ncbi:chondroitin sulfate N-acetylgalactosaminyltransferase 2-like isoform X2 [Penaeus japonicus]|uniref:chondroitin sulfate N-acetylgalactosaminyltransferase 2-like isoform X2 n=1 Tax=Penaeus japonicus TaxID=27405 RepID=UPI001C714F7C|nr:chondroitin sulfate N-acetylgalactosaminyltransferase 2-like isoform X2 [Penaeus japonicus]